MNNKAIIIIIVVIIFLVGGLFLIGRKEEPKTIIDDHFIGMEESREIAEKWILENSSTYLFDGSNLMLDFEEEILEGKVYLFVFSFESRAAGYGDRSDEMVAQVITDHTIEVIVEEGRVIGAITDGIFDEIEEEIIKEDDEDLAETMEISLYFVQVIEGQEEIIGVKRSIPYTVEIGKASIEELLKGPLLHEEAEGFSTAINEGTELQSIEIKEGVALVDFSERLEQGVAGSARVMAIRSQIEMTLMQFDTVDEVIISINGRTEDILQP